MFASLKTARSSNVRAGIVVGDRALVLVVVKREAGGKPEIEHCVAHEIQGERASELKSAIEKAGAARLPMCAVVDGDEYQLVQVEAPEVLPSEMRAAIRWRLKDAISFNVDDAAVDVFDIPEPARRTQSKMLFAVAARASAVERIASALKPAAKRFDAIDIPELCLRNLAACLPQDAKGVATLAINDQTAQLIITRQSTLYVTRRIDTRGRFNPHVQQDAPADIDAAALALEIQRSLDYYESQYDPGASRRRHAGRRQSTGICSHDRICHGRVQ